MKRRFNLKEKLRWLYPGMKVKRWILFCVFGIFLVIFGSVRLITSQFPQIRILDVFILLLGITSLILGTKKMVESFITLFLPTKEKLLVDIIYQKRYLERGPKIVVLGGGTGLSTLLCGLKEYTNNLTAIVTVADTGGSSGRIREQFDILPPGDIRNCLIALADASSLMQDLFQFRFSEGSELAGHNFGNLFITVMTKLTGDFEKAIKESSKVLAIRGQVLPATLKKVTLVAEYSDGTVVEGEDRIPKKKCPIKKVYLRPEDPPSTPEAIKAIEEAEAIVIGPGSLYTSIIPNLLVREITRAIVRSRSPRIYVCNVMTQSGETDGYTAFNHLQTLLSHSHSYIIDYCVLNTSIPPKQMLERYESEGAFPVIPDSERIKNLGIETIEGDFISTTNYVRHNSKKLAKIIIDLIFKR